MNFASRILAFILDIMAFLLGLRKRSRAKPAEEESLVGNEGLAQALKDALAEAEEWRVKYTDVSKQLCTAKKAEEDMSKEVERQKKELAGLRALNATMAEEQRKHWGERTAAKEELEAVRQAAEKEIVALRKCLEKYAGTERELQDAQKALGEVSRELVHVRGDRDNAKSLLATRTVELREASAYLAKTDTVSHADVQRMIEGLNAEIFQLAALVTDSVAFAQPARIPAADLPVLLESAGRLIGKEFVQFLHSNLHGEDAIWVQLALQATANAFASRTVSAWDLRFKSGQNSLLTDIHQQMFENEPQAISARWRILSRRYAGRLGREVDVVTSGTTKLVDTFKIILVISGAQDFISTIDWPGVYSKANSIIASSVKVQRVVGEDIASADFQIICPFESDPFDLECMADVEECARGERGRPAKLNVVICTSELGLRRCEKVDGEGSGVKSTTLLKAKVVLPPACEVVA
ncbi:hypothetical protein PsYK624_068240 [Phanerochaete sordida]|uniref:Uncharacterized protein n=1 Tax=Phanerochaete sordida TaxID=48140 RepID=A0A9P3G9Y9_9APHY|nr:hypothetical protein PsYK624_068240 [Phanerochaete sordida]